MVVTSCGFKSHLPHERLKLKDLSLFALQGGERRILYENSYFMEKVKKRDANRKNVNGCGWCNL